MIATNPTAKDSFKSYKSPYQLLSFYLFLISGWLAAKSLELIFMIYVRRQCQLMSQIQNCKENISVPQIQYMTFIKLQTPVLLLCYYLMVIFLKATAQPKWLELGQNFQRVLVQICVFYSTDFIVFCGILKNFPYFFYTDYWHVINFKRLKSKEPKLQKLMHPLS